MPIRPGQRLIQGLLGWALLSIAPLAARVWLPELAAPALLAWLGLGLAGALWALAFWLYRADWLALLALLPAAGHLAWQVATLDGEDPDNPLDRFRANRWTGALVAAACFVVGNA